MAKKVTDLMAVTGWSRHTVIAALRNGTLPGYQVRPHGHWTTPDKAFAEVEAGTWRPPTAPITVRPTRRPGRRPRPSTRS